MIAFGGAGGLFAADVADFLGIKVAVSPPNPGNLSAFGLHVCDIKRDYVRTLVRQQSTATVDELEGLWAELERLGRDEIAAEGVAREEIALERSADVRYVGEGHEVLVAIPAGLAGAAAVDHMWSDFHRVHDDTFGFHYEGTQDVEVVSLRVQAIGRMHRPYVRAIEPGSDDASPAGARDVYWRGRGWVSCPIWHRESLSRGFTTRGPGIVKEYGSTLVVPEGWALRNDDYGNLILEKEHERSHGQRRTTAARPDRARVITGTIRTAELEIEAAVERTARSPMIRDQHDYRVALFDARGRKLTGRSYAALVEPVFEYFDEGDIHPGDIFFWNDPYNSAGGIGHIPDLCTTIPIFYGDRLIGFSQVFGHHDDVGGSVPGSLPTHATDMWTEGLVVPPIKIYERGKINEAVFKIISRNSRLSEHLRGDLDAEIGAARLGSQRIVALAERYGVDALEAAYDAIIDNCAETIRRELLPMIRDGVYSWEDYIEDDGVEGPQMHTLRMTMTKTADKIVLDFTGTSKEAKGPINWPIDYADGKFARKWMGPVLRSLAATPERAAEIDMNEGVLDVIELKFPPKGTLVTPSFGKATGLRFFPLLRSLGIFAALLAKATGGACRPTTRRSESGACTAGASAMTSSFSERSWAAAVRVAHGRTAAMWFTSCRTRAICPPSFRRPDTRSSSNAWGWRPTQAVPAAGAAVSATTSACARLKAARRSPTPTAR